MAKVQYMQPSIGLKPYARASGRQRQHTSVRPPVLSSLMLTISSAPFQRLQIATCMTTLISTNRQRMNKILSPRRRPAQEGVVQASQRLNPPIAGNAPPTLLHARIHLHQRSASHHGLAVRIATIRSLIRWLSSFTFSNFAPACQVLMHYYI